MQVLFCFLILNMLTSLSCAKENTIDLGETGFSSPVQFMETGQDYMQSMLRKAPRGITLKKTDFSYRSAIPKHHGPPETRHLSFRKNSSLPIGAKILVFSCHDEESARMAQAVNFDYGLCIEYKSMDGIRDFKKRLGLRQPLEMADDETVKVFGVGSYPALITVHDDEFELQEGF